MEGAEKEKTSVCMVSVTLGSQQPVQSNFPVAKRRSNASERERHRDRERERDRHKEDEERRRTAHEAEKHRDG